MSISKHTTGPWRVHPYTTKHGNFNVAKDVGPNQNAVATIIGPFEKPWDGEAEANAHLIAAAPEMAAEIEDSCYFAHDIYVALLSATEFDGRIELCKRAGERLEALQAIIAKALAA